MTADDTKSVSRRRFLKAASATALAAGAGPAVMIPGRAQPKTLKILLTVGFIPTFAPWFDQFARAWGDRNDIEVTVDWVKWDEAKRLEDAEIATQQGHDLFATLRPVEEQAIDHRDIYEECERRYGKLLDTSKGMAYNPKTKKYWRFIQQYLPSPVIYRKDLWDEIGMQPDSWDDIRYGGRKIRFLTDHPVAISLVGPNNNSEGTLRALLYSFGASIQNAEHQPILKSSQTLEALKFAKALYEETMTEEMLDWDVTSNNRSMLSGEGNITIDPIAITRTAENKQLSVAEQLVLAKSPVGPAGRYGIAGTGGAFVIWKFAQNIEIAKRFLVDYVGASRENLLANKFYLLPAFPGAVPDLDDLLANDSSVTPSDKYKVLASADSWSKHYGWPGYENQAASEIYNVHLIPHMFAAAATGKMTPEEALTQADQEVRKIFDKWRALDKI